MFTVKWQFKKLYSYVDGLYVLVALGLPPSEPPYENSQRRPSLSVGTSRRHRNLTGRQVNRLHAPTQRDKVKLTA